MSLKYRIYPTKKQEKVMEKHCIQDRVIYNLCVARSSPDIMKKWYPSMPFLQYVEEYTFPVYNDAGKKIGKETRGGWIPRAWIKTDINGKTMSNWDYVKELRDDNEWFRNGSSAVQDCACRIAEQAFKNWWGNPQHFSAPKLRSKYATQGFGWNFAKGGTKNKVIKYNAKYAHMNIPKVGRVKLRCDNPDALIEKCLNLGTRRVTRDRTGKWYVSFIAAPEDKEYLGENLQVGIDVGVNATITLSTGEQYRMPELTDAQKKRHLLLKRKVSRRALGSQNRNKARKELAAFEQKMLNRKRDWVENITTELAEQYSLIVVEDLNIKNMTKSAKGTVEEAGKNVKQKTGLNREILNQGWGQIFTRLEQKMDQRGNHLLEVDPKHTSQTCFSCKKVDKQSRNGVHYKCIGCGYEANADVNAAQNILHKGIAT